MHIHLDPVGGVAGDMFVAAILDCFPELSALAETVPAVMDIAKKVCITNTPQTNGVLTGRQFQVSETERQSHSHSHTSFQRIKSDINGSKLPTGVKTRAIDIFQRLAQSEAQVHGMTVEAVTFHELGALDSIVDIVTAAHLIEELGPCTWSIAPIPIGAGRVMSQHGVLPVPAPATVNLLKGFEVFYDGVDGERVTPTGAAIVAHLTPDTNVPRRAMTLDRSGTGFGSKVFEQFPNILRAMVFQPSKATETDSITVFQFEIDDQTPEDLAIGLENIRKIGGVMDVSTSAVLLKKNRQAQHIQILGSQEAEQAILDACFEQTTTIGVRFHSVRRAVLRREHVTIDGIGVKIVQRPTGPSAKAESDDLAARFSTAARRTEGAKVVVMRALEDENGT